MVRVRLKHVHAFHDRHGRLRHYLRRPGHKAIPLPGEPGSREFLAAYQAAMQQTAQEPASLPRNAPGSLSALAASYYTGAAWKGLSAASKTTYRRIVERLRGQYGHLPVALIEARHVEAMVAARAEETPAAANHVLRTIRALLKHAVKMGLRPDNPAKAVERVSYRAGEFRTWTEAEIAQFEAHWPSGTKQRLAFALLLYTGQRRGDVVRMGRQHLTPAGLAVRQQKTGERLVLPIHAALAAELAHVPPDQLTFLLTPRCKPHTPAGFYQAFIDWCEDAGLPKGLSPHGLRKATCRRLAELNCSPRLIMAVSGHRSLAEVERYTRAVEQERMAAEAMGRIGS